jgi:sulfatase modifying factor 1
MMRLPCSRPAPGKVIPVQAVRRSVRPTVRLLLPAVLAAGLLTARGAGAPPGLPSDPTAIPAPPLPVMVRIAAGTFLMGSPPDEPGRRNLEPQHPVTITRDFLLARDEVTQGVWVAIMGANPSRLRDPRLPVTDICWLDAVSFCNRLSELAGLAPAYAIDGETVTWDRAAPGYRLPTEAEWEYACRAGTASAFAHGDSLHTDQANFDGRHAAGARTGGLDRGRPLAPGSFPASAWGLHDLHGNVAEWVWDRFDEQYGTRILDIELGRAQPVLDPAGPERGEQRILRGGSFAGPGGACRCAARGLDYPTASAPSFGLRVARNAP